MKPSQSFHFFYIAGSFVAAFIAVAGIFSDSPLLYATVPGIIGGIFAAIATVRLMKDKIDLAGFVATSCGFVFYQAFQANPVTQPEFVASLQSIPIQDKAIGIFLSNLTTAMLLLSCRIVSISLHRMIGRWVPDPAWVSREKIDHKVMTGFWAVFTLVALPNVLLGKVVMGSIDSIMYQRKSPVADEVVAGYANVGGALGPSFINIALWATSLFLIWLYLLRSRRRWVMLILAPLILLWTAGVGLQGSRTYLAMMGAVLVVYLLGNPQSRSKVFAYALWVVPVLFLSVQASTSFRSSGLKEFNWQELSASMFAIRGNEGASSSIDGIQYFRTELVEKGQVPNPVTGFLGGMVMRPVQSLLIPVPRALFPWKGTDYTSTEYDLWYENVRMGVSTATEFIGASPGLIGRELLKYGIFGPVTLFFWLGLALALADRLYSTSAASDFHRIFAALLVGFIMAEARDFVPLWTMPFLPAGVVLGLVARQARKNHLAKLKTGARPKAKSDQLSASSP
jgi:hypothetical protein